MAGDMQPSLRLTWLLLPCFAFALAAVPPGASADTSGQKSFDSPDDGMSALVEAVKSNDQPVLRALLGVEGQDLFDSGDAAANAQWRKAFLAAYDASHAIVFEENNTRAVLVVGRDGWPMRIPLIKSNGGWRFDAQHAAEETLRRHIGRNELAAIQVCLAIVDAEREFAAQNPDGDGVPGYAPKFASSPGRHDGLYWETRESEPSSPLGPLLAAAAYEGTAAPDPTAVKPYHGYLYRMLEKQGKNAPGGAYDYRVNGKLIGGFAVIAYPARYGRSGAVSFIATRMEWSIKKTSVRTRRR